MKNRSIWICLFVTFLSTIVVKSLDNFVNLQMTFLEHGIRSISGIKFSSLQPSISKCILLGLSNQECHAVNYDAVFNVCDVIITHGTVLKFESDINYTFVAFNNSQNLIKTGIVQACKYKNVQWKEQWTRSYVPPNNPVYVHNTAMNRRVCQAVVGDNELPGVVHTSDKTCKFILRGILSLAEFYVELVVITEDQSISWYPYRVGDIIPHGSFIGGQTDKGIPLYVCRASIRGIYFSGYYDPSSGQASINYGLLERPSQIELLSFAPDGPTSAGRIGTVPCPRPNVRSIYAGLEWVEYWAADPVEPAAGITSGNVPQTVAVASTFTTTDIVAKCLYDYNRFCTTYLGIIVCNQWGKVLVPSVSYDWIRFTAGSNVPNNAIVVAHTTENDPLYIIKEDTMESGIGTYDPNTGQAILEHHGVQHPLTMDILTIPKCTGLNTWTDKGFNIRSGPITAMRIQHKFTVTGIQCRFGAQWSLGFWSDALPNSSVSHLNFGRYEYVKGVEIGLDVAFRYIKIFTNLEIYGPFGASGQYTNKTLVTRCGQVEFFSGQLCWEETMQMNYTFAFNIHGQLCYWNGHGPM